LIKPKVFVVQPVFEEALEELRLIADIEIFPQIDRMMQKEEIIKAVRRNEYLFTLGDTVIDADIINENPDLKGERAAIGHETCRPHTRQS